MGNTQNLPREKASLCVATKGGDKPSSDMSGLLVIATHGSRNVKRLS